MLRAARGTTQRDSDTLLSRALLHFFLSSSTFPTVGRRNGHVKEVHGFPKGCPKGCEGLFETRQALVRHIETHSDFKPTRYLVLECTCDNVFERAVMYRNHVKKVHKIIGKDPN